MIESRIDVSPRATPESQGVNSQAILQFIEAAERDIHELHSFMLLRHGKVIAECWWSPYQREDPHMLFSLSKSFTSTAVGLAVAEGRFSIDDTVVSFFPDEAPAEPSENLAAMRVRHLLAMSTGHDTDTMPPMIERSDGDWIKAFLTVPVTHEPGTHFLYNTGATYILSAIVQKTTGMKLVDYLETRLFAPLGIEGAHWQESPQGINTGGFGLSIRTEDIARFGQLYLQKGDWQGKQLVPEAWVETATTLQTVNGQNPANDWEQGYGFQFWLCRHNAYRGDGAFGQYCVVMPEQDAVLAITGGLSDMQKPLSLVWDILLAAMCETPLPEDAAAQRQLTEKRSALQIPPVAGETSSPTAAGVTGQRYTIEPNVMEINTVAYAFGAEGCTITIKKDGTEEHIVCGYGRWQPGETRLFNQPWEIEPAPIVASGAWTNDNRFDSVVRFHHTPFYLTFTNTFGTDNIEITSRINVGFRPPETVAMRGNRL